MPAKMHRVMVEPPHKWGIGCDPVYRYLICCKRCQHWSEGGDVKRGFGRCKMGRGVKAGNALSCDEFLVFDANEIYLETARINGELTKVIIGGDVFYCDDDEISDLYAMLIHE